MKHFISRTGELFDFEEDGSQDDFITDDLAPLTDEQLADVRAQQALDSAPTPEQILKSAIARRDDLLLAASIRIAPLQDAVDFDEATTEEIASLKLWKQYRVAVNRVQDQPSYPSTIQWPVQPA